MKPKVEAMIVCDAVHRDPGTGKHTLLGTFNVLAAPSFPTLATPFYVFLGLSGIRSPTAISLRVVSLRSDEDHEEVLWDTPNCSLPAVIRSP
jgi:hypothetical protein